MEEEALKDAYGLFVNTGYNGSIDDYKKLISTNADALKDAHKLFVETGYNGDLDKFSTLIGVKKKSSEPTSADPSLVSETKVQDGSLDSSAREVTFDPEGDGYDYETADKYGIKPDETGHWPSRVPETGQILKGRKHQTFHKTEKGENEAGYIIEKGNDGKYYSHQQGYDYKPIRDADGKEVYYTDKEGNLQPAREKVAKGQLSTTEQRAIMEQKANAPVSYSAELQDFQAHVNLTDEDNAAIDQLVQDKENISFWDYATESPITSIQRLLGFKERKIIPFEDQIKEVKQQSLLDNKKLSDEDLYEAAKLLFREEEATNIYNDKANRYLKNLDAETQYNIKKEVFDIAEHLSEKNKTRVEVNAILEKSITDNLQKIAAIEATDPNELTEDDVESYNQLRETTLDQLKKIDINQTAILKDQSDLMSAEKEFELLKRSYGIWDNFKGNMVASAAEIGIGLVDFGNYMEAVNPISLTNITGSDQFSVDTEEARTVVEKRRDALRSPIQRIKSVDGFVNYMTDLVANQLPVLAVTSTGIGGLTVLGASSSGQKYAEMNDEVLAGEASYSPLQMISVPALFGGAEMVGEIPTLSILKKGGRVISSAAKQKPQLFTRSYKDIGKAWAMDYAGDTSKEVAGELFTEAIQKTGDIYLLGKEGNITDNFKEVFQDAFALTTLMKVAPHIVGAGLKPFQKKDGFKKLELNAQQLKVLNQQLSENITDTERQVITKQIETLTEDSSKLMANTIKDVTIMPKELYDEVVRLNNEAGELRQQAQDIYVNGTSKGKDQLIKGLEDAYSAIEAKRNAIIDGTTTIVDVLPLEDQDRLKREALKQLTEELNPDGSKNMTIDNAQVMARANEIYVERQTEVETEVVHNELTEPLADKTTNDVEVNPVVNENLTTEPMQEETQPLIPKTLKALEAENKATLPKVPTEKVFLNPVETVPYAELKKADPFLEGEKTNELPTEQVDVRAIIPTQKNLTTGNLENTQDIPFDVEDKIILFKKDGKYYVIDGHHRIANAVLKGDETIEVKVFDNDAQPISQEVVPKPSEPKTEQVKRIKPKGVRGEFDVTFDSDGNVSKINSVKDGREIPRFVEKKVKKTKNNPNGVTLQKNGNYSRIEAEAMGGITENQSQVELQNKRKEALKAYNPSDAYGHALAYLANGGAISLESAKKETGLSNTEVRWVTAFKKDADLPSVEAVAEKLAADSIQELNEQDLRNALIDIISSNKGINEVQDTIVDEIAQLEAATQNAELDAFFNSLSEKEMAQYEAVIAEDSYISELTDSEILDYYGEQYGTTEQAAEKREGHDPKRKTGIDSVQEREGTQGSAEQVEVSDTPLSKRPLDSLSKLLDALEKDLNDFGDQHLSMGIPLVIAKGTVKAMQLALKTAQTTAEVLQAGLDYIKSTKYYKSLSAQDQSQINVDTLDGLIRASMTAPIDPHANFEKVNDTFDKARQETRRAKPMRDQIKNLVRTIIGKFSDRQYLSKILTGRSGMKRVKNLMINAHGASGKAKRIFDKAYDKIYKGLNKQDRNILDNIIQSKRFIAIDNNRESRGLDPVVHPNYIDKAQSEAYLSELENRIGTEKYKDLEKRANAYFKVYDQLLEDTFKNGMISEAVYDSLKGLDYQPRLFLQFITDFDNEVSLNAARRQKNETGGLSKDVIKTLDEGDASSLVLDSLWLLSTSLVGRYKAMATNNINKAFMKDEFPKAKKRFEALNKTPKKQWTKEDFRFHKYFKELESKIIDNPVIRHKTTKAGVIKPVYKYDKIPDHFAKAYWFDKGVRHEFFIEQKLHDIWFDNIDGFFNGNSNVKEIVSYASGSALVKGIATGNNPAFAIVNTPRDFAFTVIFSDQYSKVVPKAMVQVAKDVIKAIGEIRRSDQGRDTTFEKYVAYGGDMAFLSTQGQLKKNTMLSNAIDKLTNPKAKDMASTIFNNATLKKLSNYSELMFRMALFQRSVTNKLKELGYKSMADITDQDIIDDIYNEAVANARSLLDFNQGGTTIKDLEPLIPYINTAVQGSRVAMDEMRRDPVGTTSRIIQASLIGSSVPIMMSLALISSAKDDEDDRSSYELYLNAMDGLSMYQKSQYFNIVTGQKNEDGEYRVIKIARNQQLSPLMVFGDHILQNQLRKITGNKTKDASTMLDEVKFSFNNNIMPVDLSSPADVFTRTPIVKAVLTYETGYDFFREAPLTHDIGKVPLKVEGMSSQSVEDFYKTIGKEYDLSPARTKGFVESMITSPNTNPFVGMLYGGADALTSDKDMSAIAKDFGESIYRSTGKRIIGYTSEFNRKLNADNGLKKKLEDIKSEKVMIDIEKRQLARDFADGKLSATEFNERLKKYGPDVMAIVDKSVDYRLHKNIDRNIIDLKYEQNAEARAYMIAHYYGNILDGSKESNKVLGQMMLLGGVWTDAVKKEYMKLIKK